MYTHTRIRMIRQIREGNRAIDARGIDRFFAVRLCFNFPKFRVFLLSSCDTSYELSVLERSKIIRVELSNCKKIE